MQIRSKKWFQGSAKTVNNHKTDNPTLLKDLKENISTL